MIKEILEHAAQKESELIKKFAIKKEDISVSEVMGTDMGGNHPAEWYDQVQKTIDAYTPEWKMYGKDATKVILQKDLALRVLAKKKNFFMFRDVNDDGSTVVKLPVESKRYKDIEWDDTWAIVSFAIGVIIGLIICVSLFSFFFVSHRSPFVSLGVTGGMGVLGCFCSYCYFRFIQLPRWKKNRAEWAERIRKDRRAISPMNHDSWSDWNEAEINRTQLQASIKTDNTDLNAWYDESIQKTVIFAAQVKGTKGWLWLHHLTEDNGDCPHDFPNGEFEYMGLDGIIKISNDDDKGSIVPFIETDNSFIFIFPKREGDFYEKNFVREEEHLVDCKLHAINQMFDDKEEGMFLSFLSDDDEWKKRQWEELERMKN